MIERVNGIFVENEEKKEIFMKGMLGVERGKEHSGQTAEKQ